MQSIVPKVLLAFIFFACTFIFSPYLSSTSTDMLVGLLIMYILFTAIVDEHAILSRSLIFGIIPVFCITLKLSSAPILLITLVLFIYLYKGKEYKSLILVMLIGSIVILPWLIRFVILTGYLLYPFPSIDLFNFDWKMPLDMLILEKNAVLSWARIPDQDFDKILAMPISEWLPIWLRRINKIYWVLYSLAIISPILVFLKRKSFKKDPIALAAWLIAFCGFLFGFFSAPDPRFSYGFIFATGIIPLFFFNFGRWEHYFSPLVAKWVFVGIFLFLGRMAVRQIKTYSQEGISLYTLLHTPQKMDYTKKEIDPTFALKKSKNTLIYVPEVDDRCFDHCLPCTPYFNVNIEKRSSDYRDGFRRREEE